MSLLIKGVDLPKNCAVCPCCVDVGQGDETEYFCSAEDCAPDIQDITAGRLQTCPLVEIPTPHSRLIDADAHIQSLKENQCGERCRKNHDCVNCGIGMYIRIVENEPTIIEAEGNT